MEHRRGLLAFPIGAFLLLWLVPWLQLGPWDHEYSALRVLNYGPHSNALSGVPYFLRAIGLGLLAVLVVEPLKWTSRSTFPLGQITTAYQLSLLVDSVRVNALDWFAYWLHFLGVAELELGYATRPALPISFAFPWISLGGLVFLVGATDWQHKLDRREQASDQPSPNQRAHFRRLKRIVLASLSLGAAAVAAVLAGFNSWLAHILNDALYWRRAAVLVALAGAGLAAGKWLVSAVKAKL